MWNLKVEHFEVTKKWCDCKLQSLLALTTNSYNQQLGPIIGDLCNLVFVIINVLSICSPRLRLILAVSTDTTPSSRVQSYVNRAQNTTHPSGSSVVMWSPGTPYINSHQETSMLNGCSIIYIYIYIQSYWTSRAWHYFHL